MMEIIFAVTSVGIREDRWKKVMTTIEDLTEKQKKFFCEMIDTIIMNLDKDPEMKENFDYLNDLAFHRKMSIYDLLLEVYEKTEVEDRLDDWKKRKGFK